MSANIFSNLDFHGLAFENVKIKNDDWSNKNVLLVKDDISTISDASSENLGVTFFYVGDLVSKSVNGETKNFKKNCIYRSTSSGTGTVTYSWAEIELGGSSSWGVVGETADSDLPSSGVKLGQQFRVASNKLYKANKGTDGSYSKDATQWANVGDFFFVSAVELDGTKPVYTLVTSGDDVAILNWDLDDITADTELSEDFSLGTNDVAVAFYAVGEKDAKTVEYPIMVSNYIVATSGTDTSKNSLKVTFDTIEGLATLNGATISGVKAVVHRS